MSTQPRIFSDYRLRCVPKGKNRGKWNLEINTREEARSFACLLRPILDTHLLRLYKLISDDLCMPLASWADVAFKPLRNSHKPRHKPCFRLDGMTVTVNFLPDIESPQRSRDIDEKRSLCDMNARTNTAACTVGEMISLIRIVDIDVVSCWERVIKEPFRAKVVRLWIPLGVVLDGPTSW
jgi:hypothetical protein